MSMLGQENQLFEEWGKKRPDIVRDGMIDEEDYKKSNPKILFVMKEVNNYYGDLRDILREAERKPTWNNVTRWLLGIENLSQDYEWIKIETIDREQRKKYLKNIAVMNLKKSSGGHTTIQKQLNTYAFEDKLFLNRQFQIYDADLVICCGTGDIFYKVIEHADKLKWKQTRHGIWFCEYQKGKFMVDYVHPEARASKQIVHYALMDALREIRQI